MTSTSSVEIYPSAVINNYMNFGKAESWYHGALCFSSPLWMMTDAASI